MNSHIVKSSLEETPLKAAISVIRESLFQFEDGAQAVHIIIANLIETGNDWCAVVSVVPVPDLDEKHSETIVFGHLPAKYSDLYDDILPEVDHLNLIDNQSIWDNIKLYLLDIYFYQAVHFGRLKRLSGSSGGYFKEASKTYDADPDLKAMLYEHGNDAGGVEVMSHLSGIDAFHEVTKKEGQTMQSKQNRLAKKQQIVMSEVRDSPKIRAMMKEIGYVFD